MVAAGGSNAKTQTSPTEASVLAARSTSLSHSAGQEANDYKLWPGAAQLDLHTLLAFQSLEKCNLHQHCKDPNRNRQWMETWVSLKHATFSPMMFWVPLLALYLHPDCFEVQLLQGSCVLGIPSSVLKAINKCVYPVPQ